MGYLLSWITAACPEDEGHECFFLPRYANESGPLPCRQNRAYQKDCRQQLYGRRSSCSSTQTLREIHHAANAQVNYVGIYPLSVLNFLTRSFFSIPRNDDPDPRLLFKGLRIAACGQDICTEHMGKYPVIFFDFKVRVFSQIGRAHV